MQLGKTNAYACVWELLERFRNQRSKVKVIAMPNALFQQKDSHQLTAVRPLYVHKSGRGVEADLLFTALHGMQTRSYDENSVCPSVRLSVCLSNACIVTKRKKDNNI